MQANARIGFMCAKKRKQTIEKENMSDSAEQNHKTFSPLGMILTYAKNNRIA